MSLSSYVRSRAYPSHKIAKLNEYIDLISKYSNLLIIDVSGIPASSLHEIRHKLRKRGIVLKVVKNKIFIKAFEKVKGKVESDIVSKLTGQNAVVFTNDNPFALALLLKREYKMTRKARPGDVATSDVIVPSGNTGITPGPSMSLFGKLKIPIRVTEGTIWVASDTVVAKKGDVISPELADLLGKLNIKPIEITIPVKFFVIDGRFVAYHEIDFEPEHYTKLFEEAQAKAVNLALNAQLPLPEVMSVMVARAGIEAMNLATLLALPLPEVIERCLARAYREASAVYQALRQVHPEFQ